MSLERDKKKEIISELVLRVYTNIKAYHEKECGPLFDLEDQEIERGFNLQSTNNFQSVYPVAKTLDLSMKMNMSLAPYMMPINHSLISKIKFTRGYKTAEYDECHVISIDDRLPVDIEGLTVFRKLRQICQKNTSCGLENYAATWLFNGDEDISIIFCGGIYTKASENDLIETCGFISGSSYTKKYIKGDKIMMMSIGETPPDPESLSEITKGSLRLARRLAIIIDETLKEYNQ